jgi:DNA recombination protein RmuC
MSELLLAFLIFFLTLIIIVLFLFLKKSKTDKEQDSSIKDLERRITDLMTDQLKEIRGSVDGTSRTMHEQISSFTRETVQLKEELKHVQETMKNISTFQEIFRSPKLRGQWGEASLGHILGQYFPKELYKIQYLFSSGEQVDAVIKLPNDKLLPIDAKFSSINFEKMKGAKNEEEEKFYRKKFIADVKFNVDSIASKYILPVEGTLDYALMYIPAEAIYYEIIAKEMDLLNYAQSKKITFSSPNTFYSSLRTIEHWFRNIQISQKTQEIIEKINRVHQDSYKLQDNFRKLGRHLKDASSAYEKSEKRLSLLGKKTERLSKINEIKKISKPKQENVSSN